MKNPSVTLGLPAFNEALKLEQTVATILNQSYTDFELLLADNCSTDDTLTVMQRLAASDGRIRILTSPRNMGAVHNFARLLEEARGEYFAWVGAHDYYHPDWLVTLLETISADDLVALVFPQTQRVLSDYSFLESGRLDIDSRPYRLRQRVRMLCAFPGAGERIYGLFRTAIAKQCPVTTVIRWDAIYLCCVALMGNMVSVPQCLRYRSFDATPAKGAVLMHSALRRQYRILYPDGNPPNLWHFLPHVQHLWLLLRHGLRTLGIGRLGTIIVALYAYHRRSRKNLVSESQYFWEQLKQRMVPKNEAV